MCLFCQRFWKEALILAVVSPLLLTAAALGNYGFICECFLFPSTPSGMDQISLTDWACALIGPSQTHAYRASAHQENELKVG